MTIEELAKQMDAELLEFNPDARYLLIVSERWMMRSQLGMLRDYLQKSGAKIAVAVCTADDVRQAAMTMRVE